MELSGAKWSLQEAKDLLFPILKEARNLEKFEFSPENLFKTEFINAIMEDDMNEKLIKVLYFKGELTLLNGFEMLDNPSYYF